MNYIMSITSKHSSSIIGAFDVTLHGGKVTNMVLRYIALTSTY